MTIEWADYHASALRAGLSPKAAGVYVTLLLEGRAIPPKAIVIKSKLHRQYVYDALEELRARRLVVQSGEGKRVRYQAASPDRLLMEAEKARLEAEAGVQNLMKLYDRSPAGVVEVIRGRAEVIESELELLRLSPYGSTLDIVGGAGMKWVELFEGRIEEWEALRKERAVKLRYIGAGEDVVHNREVSIIENESRTIPGIGDIVNVTIRPDSVTFNIYEPEVMAVRVKSAAAVESQRALFEVLWAAAH